MSIAVAVKHMLAAGMGHEAIVEAISEMEEAAANTRAICSSQRSKAAERQARYRERKKRNETVTDRNGVTDCDVTSDGSGDHPSSPLVPPLSPTPPNPPYNPPTLPPEDLGAHADQNPPDPPKRRRTAKQNGSRIAENWQPSPKDLAFATKHELTPQEIEDEADRFRDHWKSTPGKDGRKLDWEATWRNWITRPGYGIVARKKQAAERAASRKRKAEHSAIAGGRSSAIDAALDAAAHQLDAFTFANGGRQEYHAANASPGSATRRSEAEILDADGFVLARG